MLAGWFECEIVKGAFAFDGIVGAYAAPSTPGTAYVLLHHCFGEVNGKPGVWGHAVGGMGAITQAMAASATARGAVIRTDAAVARVLVAEGRATGVVLASGEVIRARAVAANVGPKLLFGRLVPEEAVAPEVHARFARIRTGSGTFRMNVALTELPDFRCRPGKERQAHHGAGIVIGPTLDYLERAYLDARTHGWSQRPVVEMLIPPRSTTAWRRRSARRQPLRAARRSSAPRRAHLGGSAREGGVRRCRHRHGERARAHFRGAVLADKCSRRSILNAASASSTATSSTASSGSTSCSRRGRSSAPRTTACRCRASTCAARVRIGGGVTGAPGHNAAREIIRDLKGWHSVLKSR